ncbi:hypothetical protein PI23P_10340 [Polaribacter irgensii 23-P]|uniref:Uncharacterized protein n=1 Tax=Polaribacter irgensii 23-P TaxID=313594 RepID=A4C0S7_9FLAO|nr:hypothetical protein PI23P_10340 [Polaribacter irgensii 23-P]
MLILFNTFLNRLNAIVKMMMMMCLNKSHVLYFFCKDLNFICNKPRGAIKKTLKSLILSKI